MIVYAAVAGDRRQAGSLQILEAIAGGQAAGTSSPAVIEEVWHLELSGQVPGLSGQARSAATILRPLLAVDQEVLDLAFDLKLAGDPLPGANDRLHAATCIRYGIETILSADRGFDSVPQLRRVDPLDPDALAELW